MPVAIHFLLNPLEGRVDEPPDYLKQNTQLLHFERLQNHEFDSQQMANFSRRLTNVENNLQRVTTDLQGLKDNVLVIMKGVETIVSRLSVQGVRAIIDDTDTGVAVLPISSTMYYTDFWSCLKSIEVTEGSAGLYKCIEYVLLNFSLLYGCGAWLANSAVKRIVC
ncbi:unnamed protein product [Rotaria socialis]|uniref:Uncharacterized protein n=1 Tax=Rotaria socialis TaxID=392032 RepID=A0A817YFD5_9BILA|nr:unnamed protein product [Rotaria socialis]